MNSFQRNIFRTVTSVTAPAPILEAGSISSSSQAAPELGCNLLVNSTCYIDTATNGAITSGDRVYHDAAGTNPIAGGNQYYKMTLINNYVVLIDGVGVISVHSICA